MQRYSSYVSITGSILIPSIIAVYLDLEGIQNICYPLFFMFYTLFIFPYATPEMYEHFSIKKMTLILRTILICVILMSVAVLML